MPLIEKSGAFLWIDHQLFNYELFKFQAVLG